MHRTPATPARPASDLELQMAGFGLTTADILYHLPDYPGLLQSYIWQRYDLAPDFPELNRFLDFWTATLDGPVHSVRVAHKGLISPAELRQVNGVYALH